MTFKQLLEEVIARGFENVSGEEGGEARIKRWINQAYREIVDFRAWGFLEETAEGTAPLTIEDLGHVLSAVNLTHETRLTFVERAALIHFDPALTATGTATQWHMDGDSKLAVYPLDTGSTIQVRYLMAPADLKEDNDEPVIPESYQGLIVDGAVLRAYKTTDNYEAAAFARRELNDGLRSMVKTLRKSYDGNRSIVRTGTVNDYL